MIVCSAMLVRQRFYGKFAAHLAERGFRVFTADNRGVGRSLAAQRPDIVPRLRHWGERDLPAMIAYAKRSAPSHRLFVVGHSMGGQVVALHEAVHRLDGILTVAATAAWWGHWPAPYRLPILGWYLAAPILGRLLPTVPASRLRMGPDTASSLVRDWSRWGRQPAYFLHPPFELRSEAPQYRGRVLAFSFDDDTALGCRKAVEVLHRGFERADFAHRHLHPRDVGARRLGHFGFFRESIGARLWGDVADWLRLGAPAAPPR